MQSIDFQFLALSAAVLVFITALMLVSIQEWRVSLAALSVQYIGVFILIAIQWPVMMALTKLVSGWICVIVLGMAMASSVNTSGENHLEGIRPRIQTVSKRSISTLVFRVVAAAMIGLVILSLAPVVARWIPGIQYEPVIGALILLGLGLLHLGLTADPLRVILALLTTLSGFEIMYASVEVSTLVAGLLAGVNLGLAMVGAYLFVAATVKGEA